MGAPQPSARTVIVSPVYPFPVDSGKRVVMSGLIRYWTQRVGPAGLTYVVIGGEAATAREQARPGFVGLDGPSNLGRLRNVATRTVLARHSLQESMLWSRSTARELDRLLAALNADLEIFDTVRMAQYLPHLRPSRARRVVYLDDLFSRRYADMLQTAARFPEAKVNPLGNFGSNVPAPAQRLLGSDTVVMGLLRAERALVARREDAVARSAELSLLINEHESALLRDRAGVRTVETMPPLLAPIEPVPSRAVDRPTILFLGLLSLPHNDVAICNFISRYLPAVIEAVPGVRLRIVGRAASERLVALAADHPEQVVIEGFVEDLDAVFSESSLMISPLLFGTGIKLKILDALARGLPVISTGYGVEGICTEAGQGCVIEDDLARYPEQIATMLEPAVAGRMAREARAHYERTFGPAAVTAVYDRLFDSAGPTVDASTSAGDDC